MIVYIRLMIPLATQSADPRSNHLYNAQFRGLSRLVETCKILFLLSTYIFTWHPTQLPRSHERIVCLMMAYQITPTFDICQPIYSCACFIMLRPSYVHTCIWALSVEFSFLADLGLTMTCSCRNRVSPYGSVMLAVQRPRLTCLPWKEIGERREVAW